MAGHRRAGPGGFRYGTLDPPIAPSNDKAVDQRLAMLRAGLRDYLPGPYDQLAATLHASGNDRQAARVLLAKQRSRYDSLARAHPVPRVGIRLWSGLRRWTVGYGHRPVRALGWLAALLALTAAVLTTTDPDSRTRDWSLGVLAVVGFVLLATAAGGVGTYLGDRAALYHHAAASPFAPVGPGVGFRTGGEGLVPFRPKRHAWGDPLADEPAPVLPEATDSAAEDTLVVEAYLDTDDPLVARSVFTALDDLVEVLGYERPEREHVLRGSWWRRTTTKLGEWLGSDEMRARRIMVERALQLATVEQAQAEVDVKSAEAVANLVASLQDVPQACLRVGSILLVKYQGDHGEVVLSRTLSQVEIKALERFPEIQTKPRHVLDSLATAVASLDDIGVEDVIGKNEPTV
ncbi:hypothetical protein SAMN05421810_104178 [Amycolatopsis arida]|uniref:Uncharacterized protein n=1 Tax=Amycolatopsis arida TaxID=587909 RepID=A0A1I5V083_9PSEU|nr:hypothetical protein [Amycolatopsis arida]TDX91097.1 hypothetical protein CLV69_106177 [Amycolatopsis arida]SFQ00905.1 hypothetical protein SAMN05421810_104178 [Amycolatopsis arida]